MKNGYKLSPWRAMSLSPLKYAGDYHVMCPKFLLRSFVNIMLILGGSVKSFRIFYAFYNLLTGFAVYALASLLGSPLIGLIAASIYWIMSLSPFLDAFQLHAEQYALLPLLLAVTAILLAVNGEVSQNSFFTPTFLLFLSGLLLGLVTICLKISYILEAFTILCISIFWGLSAWDLLFVFFGIASIILITNSYYYIKTRSFHNFFNYYKPKNVISYKKSMPADFNIDGGILKYNFITYYEITSCFFIGVIYFFIGTFQAVIGRDFNIILILSLPFASLISIWYQKKILYVTFFFSPSIFFSGCCLWCCTNA